MFEGNAVVIEAWNTVLFDKFSRFRHLLVEGLGGHSDELLGRGIHPEGSRVLDVGCGFGDTTVRLAADVGPSGSVVGVDCAQRFVQEGQKLAAEAGVNNASFRVADVQTDDLGGPYDYAFARFGTMFFEMPGAAMRNIRQHLVPGGRLDMIVWRKREDNPWLHEAELCVKEIVPIVSHDETDAVHCGPGPFSMSGADMMSDMLTSVGYERVCFERYDAEICIGRDLAEAIDFAMEMGPAGEIIRLAADEGEARKGEVVAALDAALRRYARGDRVWAASSTWFISARNPG